MASADQLKAEYPDAWHAVYFCELVYARLWPLIREIGVDRAKDFIRSQLQDDNNADLVAGPLCLAELDTADFDAYLKSKFGLI